MRSMHFNRPQIWALVLVALCTGPSVLAQQAQIDTLAARTAASILHSGNKKVVVFDFTEAGGRVTPLAVKLADDFSLALAASGDKLQVEDRAHVKKTVQDSGLQPRNINDPGIATWLATDLGMQVLVLGWLDYDTDHANLSVTSYNAKDGKGIALFKVAIPLTDQMRGLISDAVTSEAHDVSVSPDGKCIPSGSPSCAVALGSSPPKCLKCPSPSYTQEATDHGTQGTVTLLALIDVDGKAKDIRVVVAQPYGLSLRAVQAAQNWTFQPATGPDGKPIAVRQALEVTFHLF